MPKIAREKKLPNDHSLLTFLYYPCNKMTQKNEKNCHNIQYLLNLVILRTDNYTRLVSDNFCRMKPFVRIQYN